MRSLNLNNYVTFKDLQFSQKYYLKDKIENKTHIKIIFYTMVYIFYF